LPFHYVNYGKQTGFRYRLIFKSKTQVANDKSVKASCNEDLNIILFLFATDLLKLNLATSVTLTDDRPFNYHTLFYL